jgi:hypothetical protein
LEISWIEEHRRKCNEGKRGNGENGKTRIIA